MPVSIVCCRTIFAPVVKRQWLQCGKTPWHNCALCHDTCVGNSSKIVCLV